MKLKKHQIRLNGEITGSVFDSDSIRKRSRFPDPQWTCAEKNLKEMINYLCNQEISLSYVKYCKALKEQINVIIESFLYHD
jgi:hypothetical protein